MCFNLIGWGTTEFAGAKSDILQKVTISVMPILECQETYKDLTNYHICSYDPQKDACQVINFLLTKSIFYILNNKCISSKMYVFNRRWQYDSGGPLLWENPTTGKQVIVGVVSYGKACGIGTPSVNTRVGMYLDWIVEVTKGNKNNSFYQVQLLLAICVLIFIQYICFRCQLLQGRIRLIFIVRKDIFI